MDKSDGSFQDQRQASHWIFNNEKIKNENLGNPTNQELDSEFSNLDQLKAEQIDSLAEELEMIYYVEVSDKVPHQFSQDTLNSLDSSQSSSLSLGDIRLLKKMKGDSKLLIAEFNALLNPISDGSKRELENIFQLNFKGWIGKYFENISATNPEIPLWIKEAYKEFWNEEYAFPDNEGVILCHQSGKIVVLELGESLINALPMVHADLSNMEKYQLPNFAAFPFWFDINEAQNEEDVIATFKIQTNKKGDSILHKHGIPNKFPAIIGPSNSSFNYYFCGDFADNPVLKRLSYFKGVGLISRLLYTVGDKSDRKAFFWNFYRPLMINILDQYRNQEENINDLDSLNAVDSIPPVLDDYQNRDSLMEDSEELDSLNNISNDELEQDYPARVENNGQGWRIVIASLKSEEGTKRYLKELNNPQISAVWVDFLETNRITFGPFSNLGEAQIKYQEVLSAFPEAWMIKF
tara:strand:+ start:419 stop:1810 length:1392 start_codon:yes stop_codon:yes gene_type:complete